MRLNRAVLGTSSVDILSCVQELTEKGLSYLMIKVYLLPISSCHMEFKYLARQFMKSFLRGRDMRSPRLSKWDQALVVLTEVSFRPFQSSGVDVLFSKCTLLVAISSAKQIEDAHALPVHCGFSMH